MIALLEAGGHEHARGSGLADADGAYVPRLAQMLGIQTVINRAQDDAQYAGIEGGIVSIPKQTWQGIDRSSRVAPLTSGSALVVLDGGRNDAIAYGQPTVIMRDAFKHGLRATICAYRSCRLLPADDPLLTYSGSWGAVAAAADWLGAVTRAPAANADYVEAPVPASWPGGYGFIVCPQDDTAHGAVFTVTVDGVSKGTLDTRTAAITGTVCPATLRFAIPANATTVRVTVSSFATAARFNHIGFEVPQGSGHTRAFPVWTEGYSPPVVVVNQDPRPNSYGATGLHDGSYPPLASEYVADVVNEFATPLVVAADLETHMQKRADHFQGTDTLAPNEYGHIKAASILSIHAQPGLKPIDHAMLAVPTPAAAGAPVAAEMPTADAVVYLRGESLEALADAAAAATWENEGTLADATQATSGARPVVAKELLNGRAGLLFDIAAWKYLDLPDLSALTHGTVYVVARQLDPQASNAELWTMGTDGTAYFDFSDGKVYDHLGTNARKTSTSKVPRMTAGQFFLYDAVSAAGRWESYVNGERIHKTASNTVAFPAAPKLGSASGNRWGGYITDFYLFDAVHEADERQANREILYALTGLTGGV